MSACKSVFRGSLPLVFSLLFIPLGAVAAAEPEAVPTGLMGDWCKVKKRFTTHYRVEEGSLHIRGGRSGRSHRADLTCDDGYTRCEAKTRRGWDTPVTEILRLDGDKMSLTRIWGGSWKDKTYEFTFTRCPKW